MTNLHSPHSGPTPQARACAEPIETGIPGFVLRPPVLGREAVPVVTDPEELVLRERADERVVVAEVVTNADAREHLAEVAIAFGQLHQVAHDGAERARERVRAHQRDLRAGIFEDARSDGMALGGVRVEEMIAPLHRRGELPAKVLAAPGLCSRRPSGSLRRNGEARSPPGRRGFVLDVASLAVLDGGG